MVYEIFFDPNGAVWRIRITVYYLAFIAISRVVKAKKEGEKVLAPVDFPTYEAAELYTRRVGLVKAYQLRTRYQEYSTQLNGVFAHAVSNS